MAFFADKRSIPRPRVPYAKPDPVRISRVGVFLSSLAFLSLWNLFPFMNCGPLKRRLEEFALGRPRASYRLLRSCTLYNPSLICLLPSVFFPRETSAAPLSAWLFVVPPMDPPLQQVLKRITCIAYLVAFSDFFSLLPCGRASALQTRPYV